MGTLVGEVDTAAVLVRRRKDAVEEAKKDLKEAEKFLDRKVKVLNKILKASAKRVVRGHKFLQKNVSGWERKINLPRLDLSNGHYCVLGQLAVNSALRTAGYDLSEVSVDYDGAREVLGIEHPERLGFLCTDSYEEEGLEANDEYEILNELWARAIGLTKGHRPVTVESLLAGVRL